MARIYDAITPQQEGFLLALLGADSLVDAARQTKTPETTARRWMRRPEVKAAWLDMRRLMTEAAMMAIQRATALASSTLVRCMDPKMPPGVQLNAAKAILEFSQHMIELGELAERVEALEETLADRAGQETGKSAPGLRPVSIHA